MRIWNRSGKRYNTKSGGRYISPPVSRLRAGGRKPVACAVAVIQRPPTLTLPQRGRGYCCPPPKGEGTVFSPRPKGEGGKTLTPGISPTALTLYTVYTNFANWAYRVL